MTPAPRRRQLRRGVSDACFNTLTQGWPNLEIPQYLTLVKTQRNSDFGLNNNASRNPVPPLSSSGCSETESWEIIGTYCIVPGDIAETQPTASPQHWDNLNARTRPPTNLRLQYQKLMYIRPVVENRTYVSHHFCCFQVWQRCSIAKLTRKGNTGANDWLTRLMSGSPGTKPFRRRSSYPISWLSTEYVVRLAAPFSKHTLPFGNPQKKHSYRRGTARRAVLVNLCYVTRWEPERFQTAKVTLRVIQEHWQWCHSIGHVRFPIRLQLQPRLYLAPFPIC